MRKKTDQHITEEILHALLWDARMSLASLTVDCDDGTVTLQGEVENSFKKWSAEQTAGRIDGVRIVANAISVKPKQQQKDSAIAQNIEKTLTLDTRLDNTEIKYSVQQGRVTLRGKVRSLFQKIAAEETCRWVRGVTDVKNKLIVNDLINNAGEEMMHELQRRFSRDHLLKDCEVRVSISNRVVLLTGKVLHNEQRIQAEAMASQLANVAFVDNQLAVKT